jgi:hypothetical protein
MIVFSLVLILAAVTLLGLGLAAGSSTLLIASIAVSLLAAIALVIGARRSAAARRSEPAAFAEPVDPGLTEPVPVRPATRRRPAASDLLAKGNTPAGAGDPVVETMARGNTPAGAGDPVVETMATGHTPAGAAETVAGPDHAEAAAYAAGRRDAEEAPVDEPILDFTDERPAQDEVLTQRAPDYDRAAGFIDGARAPERTGDDIWAEPAGNDVPADGPGPAGGLEEADPDDPEDEPRAQMIRPGDAVRVARMQNEVLVVDGRPRYHLADCPHLIGRQTEGLPAGEAVELGFTPCGLCRPVDRLVAAAARG